jgi:NB-ARC domain
MITAALGLIAALVTLATNLIQLLIAKRRMSPEQPQLQEASVAAEARPEVDRTPSGLPRRCRPFINREAELEEAIVHVCEEREVVLAFEGSRGVGKSAAATELAYRLQEESPASNFDLSDHIFIWVNGRNGQTTLTDIGRSLCIETDDQSVSAGSDRDKLDRLRRHLAQQKTALILDNLTLSDDADSADLRELLDTVPEGSLVIAAINRDDGFDACRVPLKEFSAKDVEKLVAAQVKRLKLEPPGEFDKEFAGRLHEVVGGHPGTITWFLRACKKGGMPARERLEALQRGQGLERLFAPIWSALPEKSRALLAACDCLGGLGSAAQLAVACDCTPEEALGTVEELLDEGLLSVMRSAGQAVFVCSQAFGLFVAGETPIEMRYRSLQRLARHYVAMLLAAPEDARALLPEVDALRAVFDGLGRMTVDQVEDPELELDLQELFRRTLDVLLTLGLFDDRLTAAKHAYESAMRTGSFKCASLASEVLAGTHAFRGDFEAAELSLHQGWIAAEASGDEGEFARQQYNEGFLRYRMRQPQAALEAAAGADERAVRAGDEETLINVLDMRAAAHLYLGEVDHCEAAAIRCLAVCEEIGWERAKAFPLRFLAEVAIHKNSPEARELVARALGFSERYGDQRQQARVCLTKARMHLLARELDEAEPAASRAANEAQRLGLPPEEEEARALEDAIRLVRRSPALLDDYVARRPVRLTDAPVAGD